MMKANTLKYPAQNIYRKNDEDEEDKDGMDSMFNPSNRCIF